MSRVCCSYCMRWCCGMCRVQAASAGPVRRGRRFTCRHTHTDTRTNRTVSIILPVDQLAVVLWLPLQQQPPGFDYLATSTAWLVFVWFGVWSLMKCLYSFILQVGDMIKQVLLLHRWRLRIHGHIGSPFLTLFEGNDVLWECLCVLKYDKHVGMSRRVTDRVKQRQAAS